MMPTIEARPWHKAYEAGVPTALDLEALTVSQFLERAARDHGDATAIIYFNRRLSYRQLKDHVDRFAAALAELGVTRDSRVAIQLPNIPQTVIAYYATLSLGAQAVMTNPLYTPRELEHQWKDAGCRFAVVTDFLFESRIGTARRGCRSSITSSPRSPITCGCRCVSSRAGNWAAPTRRVGPGSRRKPACIRS